MLPVVHIFGFVVVAASINLVMLPEKCEGFIFDEIIDYIYDWLVEDTDDDDDDEDGNVKEGTVFCKNCTIFVACTNCTVNRTDASPTMHLPPVALKPPPTMIDATMAPNNDVPTSMNKKPMDQLVDQSAMDPNKMMDATMAPNNDVPTSMNEKPKDQSAMDPNKMMDATVAPSMTTVEPPKDMEPMNTDTMSVVTMMDATTTKDETI